jgi:hypothetical protein
MASIGYNQTTAFGTYTFQSIRNLRLAQQNMARIKEVMDDLTGGGVTTTNLEVASNGTIPASAQMFQVVNGQGANFYNAIVSIISAIGALQAITDLDQG